MVAKTVRLHWEEATQRLILQAVYSSSKIRKNSTANIGGVMRSEIVWLGYSESLFLQAEAALRGWAGAKGTAEDLYKEGIEASFNYYQIGADEEGQEKISKYMKGLKGLQAFKSGDREAQLEQINHPKNGLPYIPTVTKDGQSSAVQTIPAI